MRLTAISLGAGVQSTTMALMAAHGELQPMPDAAIFADTGAEPVAVYRHLAWLMESGRLPFPVLVTKAWEGYGLPAIKGTLTAELVRAASGGKQGSDSRPPFFAMNKDGSGGMIRRQCTGDYKIDPIQRRVRELLGLKRGQRWPKVPVVEQWIGISLDEATRMKPSQIPAIRNRWPLIEKRMARRDCLSWIRDHGYPEPPKSACTFCPYRSDAEWRRLRDTDAAAWGEAVMVDEAIRNGLTSKGLGGGGLYVHRSMVPLAQADLSTAEERGQLNMFENECEGMCGV